MSLALNRSLILPTLLAFTVGLFGLTSVLTAQPAATPPATSSEPTPDLLKRQQEQNAKLFKDLEQAMLRLAQRLEKSDRPEDQSRAKTIRKALEVSATGNVNQMFQQMIAGFAKTGSVTSGDVSKWIGEDRQLEAALTEILAILMTDDDTARLKAEIEKLKAFLKEAERIKRAQEIIQARTDANREKGERISKDQRDLAEQTAELARRMSGEKKPGDENKTGTQSPGGEPKDPKAESKPSAKPGEQNAENKKDTGEEKSSNKDDQGAKDPSGKDAGKDSAESKSGEGPMKPGQESGKEGDPKRGEPKAGEGKDGGEPKPGDSKDPKDGDPKGGDPKAGDPKSGEPKEGDPKGGEPKAGDPMGGEPKAGDPKGGEPKAGEPKDGKSAGKPSESKSPSQGKGDGKPSDGEAGEGKPMGGESSESQGGGKSPPSQGSPSPSPPSPGGAQPPPPKDDTPGREQIKQAYPDQKGAEDDLKKENKTEATKKEDKAIEKIAAAIKELEKRLKQLREEEALKLLANLEARCNNMLRMQIAVYENTKSIHAIVVKNNNMTEVSERQKSQVESDKENEIVVEADKALKMLEGEGSAVAFAGVLFEVREDMKSVKARLGKAYVGEDTQQIEKDIIDQLKEMIAALKKAQQDAKSGQPGQPGQPGKPGNQPLLDKLAELKLMRALQAQVNSRTTMHSKRYTGEQAKDPIIQTEIRQLSERQAKIQDMLHKLATGANQ